MGAKVFEIEGDVSIANYLFFLRSYAILLRQGRLCPHHKPQGTHPKTNTIIAQLGNETQGENEPGVYPFFGRLRFMGNKPREKSLKKFIPVTRSEEVLNYLPGAELWFDSTENHFFSEQLP